MIWLLISDLIKLASITNGIKLIIRHQNIKKSIYALPEIVGNKVKDYQIISCPGCYPTSILLPLIPLLIDRSINTKNIIIDSKSGYSGAGRGVHKKFKIKTYMSR